MIWKHNKLASLGVLFLSALFILGQDTWPNNDVVITVTPPGGPPGAVVTLTANVPNFFPLYDSENPQGTTMYVQFGGSQRIELVTIDGDTALLGVPLEDPGTKTANIGQVTFLLEVGEPVLPPGGTASFFEALKTNYLAALQNLKTEMDSLSASYLPPDEISKAEALTSILVNHQQEVADALDWILTEYPEDADSVAVILAGSGINDQLAAYAGTSVQSESKSPTSCWESEFLRLVDHFLEAGYDFAESCANAATLIAGILAKLGHIEIDLARLFAYKIGEISASYIVAGGVAQMIMPSVGDLYLHSPDTQLRLGPPPEQGKVFVWADLRTLDNSIAQVFYVSRNLMSFKKIGLGEAFDKFVYDFLLPAAQQAIPDYAVPFSLRNAMIGVYRDDVSLYVQKGGILEVAPSPTGECNELDVDPLGEGVENINVLWHAFGGAVEGNIVFVVGDMAQTEMWSGADGVYRGSSGEIQGDLGVWHFIRSGTQMTTAPCDSRIEISGGSLTVYECHHEYSGSGHGAYRIWLERFDADQHRIPLDVLQWQFYAGGELGPGGHGEFRTGLLNGGSVVANASQILTLSGSDHLCLRPPEQEASGSMYLGATLYSNFSDEEQETSESQIRISGITLIPYGDPAPYPPLGATQVSETFRGITETFRPLITETLPFQTFKGSVRIPGDLGDWVFAAIGTQFHIPDCDTRVEVQDGTLTLHECHHDYLGFGEGGWRLYLDTLNGGMPGVDVRQVDWDMSYSGSLGSGYTSFGMGFDLSGLWEYGSLATGLRALEPPQMLELVDDGTSYPPFYFRLGLYGNNHSSEENYTEGYFDRLAITIDE